jgi:CRISPR-associated protein (TIGR03986 family)
MRPPQHHNPTRDDRTACAPYNFVPLPEVVVPILSEEELAATVSDERARERLLDERLPRHDRYHEGRYTGHFEVSLTTRTPLYVRAPVPLRRFLEQEEGADANNPFREQVKNAPDFFHTGDPTEPVIPGSSLRGMLRGLLEIVSYGKVQSVTEQRLFFRTVEKTSVGRYYRERMANKVETGFIRRESSNRFVIVVCPMARVFGDQLGACHFDGNGANARPSWTGTPRQWQPVWVRLASGSRMPPLVSEIRYENPNEQGWQEGRLIITGLMQNKRKEFVFLLPAVKDAERIAVPDEMLERFHDDDQLTQWQERAFRANDPESTCRPRDGWLRSNPGEPGDPVFFLREEGTFTFFGRAGMFRLPYGRSPSDLILEHMRRPSDIDYAEALFGFTRRPGVVGKQGDRTRAYAGRVFVTDARLEQSAEQLDPRLPPLVPSILATPKPTAFQHYLTQQRPDSPQYLNHYGDEPKVTTLRGYKLYWHQGPRQPGDLKAAPGSPSVDAQGEVRSNSTQHTQMRPVGSGTTFRFRVYFENLSDRELGALCWALHPLGDVGRDYCHALGMGKPLGMGVVKLHAHLVLSDRRARYTSLFDGDGASWQTGEQKGVDLTDRTELERLVAWFEAHLLRELRPQPAVPHLLGLRRIAMLLKLLEWPGFPPDLSTTLNNRPRASSGLPNTRYMTVQLSGVAPDQRNEYRYRPVLPDPSFFGDLTGTAEPQAGTPPSFATPPPRPPRQDQRPQPQKQGGKASPPRPVVLTTLLSNGQTVDAVVVADPKAKGRLFARHELTGLVGNVLNPGDVPTEQRQVGQRISLRVHSISTNGKQVAFRWANVSAGGKKS